MAPGRTLTGLGIVNAMESTSEPHALAEGAVVLCSGQATLDHVFEVAEPLRPGHKHRARRHRQTGGGVAANAAVAISRLGGRAVFVGCVGGDAAGDAVIAGLDEEGVDTRLVLRVPDLRTPMSSIVVEPGGARTIVNHTPDCSFRRRPPSVDAIRASAVLDDGRWPAASEELLWFARNAGIPGVVDVDRVPDDRQHRDAVLRLGSHLVFSAPALEAFSGLDDPVAALRAASLLADGLLFVTLGEHGVVWLDGDVVRAMPAFPVDVVDTTGAGDVFHGAFALALAEGRCVDGAVRFASAAAALKCTMLGGREGAPTRTAVEEFLADREVRQ